MTHLSRREAALLHELCADGAPNKIIAYRMDLAENSIKVLTNRIFQKVGVGNRAELVVWAFRNGVAR